MGPQLNDTFADGFVLVPPPLPDTPKASMLPPSNQHPPLAPPPPSAPTLTMKTITIRYEKFSNIEHPPTIHETYTVTLPENFKPMALRSDIVGKMGLFLPTAKVACQIVPSRAKPHAFNTETDVSKCLKEYFVANSRRRTTD
ncbi:hypothetical protein FRC11_005152 [Ceratobasidium sp. 423]|nr:hypothetical protein FRC11_005152 [Ceratobasidium sp. 423]